MQDMSKDTTQMRKIKIITDTVYEQTQQTDLSSYVLGTLEQCKKLTAEQCQDIFMTKVWPTIVTKVGIDRAIKIWHSWISKFSAEGYKTGDTMGDIIVGPSNVLA